jgi:hypothetical protein
MRQNKVNTFVESLSWAVYIPFLCPFQSLTCCPQSPPERREKRKLLSGHIGRLELMREREKERQRDRERQRETEMK